jgi:phosphate transport system substrate-binding protein
MRSNETVIKMTMKMFIAGAVFIAGIIAIPAFAGAQQADMSWTGCGITRKAFMAEAAAAYKIKTGITISITGGGAMKGIRDAAAGRVDMGGTCRPPIPHRDDSEKGLVITHVAWDALVVMVNPNNPVNDISSEQVRKIFEGKMRFWKDLGAPELAIITLATRIGMLSGVGYMTRIMLYNDPVAFFSQHAKRLKSSTPVEKMVEKTKNAIGISGVSSAIKRKVKLLALNGVKPTKENIASGKYTYYRPLFLVTKGKPTGKIKDFIDWLLSAEGQKVVSDNGTVNLAEGHSLNNKYKYWEQKDSVWNYNKLPAPAVY